MVYLFRRTHIYLKRYMTSCLENTIYMTYYSATINVRPVKRVLDKYIISKLLQMHSKPFILTFSD